MTKPVVFLDFDGVLNCLASTLAFGGQSSPNPVSVGLMCRLVKEADANVVISSAWRIGASVSGLQATLVRWGGGEVADRTIGKTPQLGEKRGVEIAAWLAENPSMHNGAYVIVDDDADMLDGQLSRFVQTRHRDGFGASEFVRAMQIIAPNHRDTINLAWYAQRDRPLSSDSKVNSLAWEE